MTYAGACGTATSPPTTSCSPSTPTASTTSTSSTTCTGARSKRQLDALLVRRDLSTYPPYKQAGNGLLSGWATLWAGHRLYDVESGYRIFRLGALADALTYYRGYKYSETVEVAVVLCRLGYRVRNDVLVPVPVYRSRTRMIDVFIDLAAIPMAAFRVTVRRPPGKEVPSLAPPLAVTAAAASAGLHDGPRPGAPDSAPVEVAGQAEQLVEPHRLEAFRPQPVDDQWQRRQQHRSIGGHVPVEPVVQQDDRSRAGLASTIRSATTRPSRSTQSWADVSQVTACMPSCRTCASMNGVR